MQSQSEGDNLERISPPWRPWASGETTELKLDISESEVISSVISTYEDVLEQERLRATYGQEDPSVRLEESTFMKPAKLFDDKMEKKNKNGVETVLSEELQIITKERSDYTCIFCKSSVIDEINLGPLYFRGGVVTHYYCMLFSSALTQNGKDYEGILGFLEVDIMKEARRSFRLKCMYCCMNGASIGCCTKSCKAKFHYRCGVENGANFQFFGNYESFCPNHFKKQIIPIGKEEWSCLICMLNVKPHEFPIMASCCKNSVFHRGCLQQMALSAGYFFKCPTCNCADQFVKEMKSLGIYVPEQDASWERDNAFQELYFQYSTCDAEKCLCDQGRSHCNEKGDWAISRCRLCGASAIHKKCSNLKSLVNWACLQCTVFERKGPIKRQHPPVPKLPPEPKPCSSRQALLDETKNVDTTISVAEFDKDVDFAKLKLRKPAADYFPYSKSQLAKLSSNSTLPDWRGLSLHVNLSPWFNIQRHNNPVKKLEVPNPRRVGVSDNVVLKPRNKQMPVNTKQRKNRSKAKSRWSKGLVLSRQNGRAIGKRNGSSKVCHMEGKELVGFKLENNGSACNIESQTYENEIDVNTSSSSTIITANT